MKVPFVNLDRQLERIRPELEEAFARVLESKDFILGSFVEQFELDFAAAHGANYCVGCSSGTSAISLVLEALGVGPGDEVITQANSFFATAEAIIHVGAVPVFVDCDERTYSISYSQLSEAITERTKAVIPVQLYGNIADMDQIVQFVNEHQLYLVEDAAQAHLATYKGKFAGTFGDAGTFSFYPGKNLGALGDAGAIFVQDATTAELLRKLRNHGRTLKYEHDAIGYNHRMDGLQAAFLSVKLQYLQEWTDRRREVAAFYNSELADLPLKRAQQTTDSESSFHLYVIEVEDRERIREKLSEKGVQTGVHYPIPLHKQPALADAELGEFPVVEQSAKRLLSLPLCGEITDQEVEFVIASLKQVLKSG